MKATGDFEDLLRLLHRHRVRYLIIGGMAFAYHAVPRFTKDMDIWIGPEAENIARANRALAEFGSPQLLDPGRPAEILQLGVAPNRVDLIRRVGAVRFATAWRKRVRGRYGHAPANWVDLDSLIRIKNDIDDPRHQEDARILKEARRRLARRK